MRIEVGLQSGGTALWGEVHPEKRDQLKAAMGSRMWGKLCSPTVLGRFIHEMWGPHREAVTSIRLQRPWLREGGEGGTRCFPKKTRKCFQVEPIGLGGLGTLGDGFESLEQ